MWVRSVIERLRHFLSGEGEPGYERPPDLEKMRRDQRLVGQELDRLKQQAANEMRAKQYRYE
jgi:hypothetical protein